MLPRRIKEILAYFQPVMCMISTSAGKEGTSDSHQMKKSLSFAGSQVCEGCLGDALQGALLPMVSDWYRVSA